LPVLSSSRHGDHYVTVQVEIPKKLSRKEKELLEEWRKLEK
jgi:DnaJ-class molecular chaperone